jgi:hypothetical protein
MAYRTFFYCNSEKDETRMEYKQVDIYVDPSKRLILIANGIIEKWGGIIANIDIVKEVEVPYSDEQIETSLEYVFQKCHSLTPVENEITPLEKFLGIKGYEKSIKGKKLVIYSWDSEEGYSITPTKKQKGFVALNDKKINLGHEFIKGNLAKALREAIENSK